MANIATDEVVWLLVMVVMVVAAGVTVWSRLSGNHCQSQSDCGAEILLCRDIVNFSSGEVMRP